MAGNEHLDLYGSDKGQVAGNEHLGLYGSG